MGDRHVGTECHNAPGAVKSLIALGCLAALAGACETPLALTQQIQELEERQQSVQAMLDAKDRLFAAVEQLRAPGTAAAQAIRPAPAATVRKQLASCLIETWPKFGGAIERLVIGDARAVKKLRACLASLTTLERVWQVKEASLVDKAWQIELRPVGWDDSWDFKPSGLEAPQEKNALLTPELFYAPEVGWQGLLFGQELERVAELQAALQARRKDLDPVLNASAAKQRFEALLDRRQKAERQFSLLTAAFAKVLEQPKDAPEEMTLSWENRQLLLKGASLDEEKIRGLLEADFELETGRYDRQLGFLLKEKAKTAE